MLDFFDFREVIGLEIEDAFGLLDKYNLRERADRECILKKLDKAPYDMLGHHKVYCSLLDEKLREIRDLSLKKQKEQKHCNNMKAVKANNSLHEDCFFNRLTFNKNGACDECTLGIELAALDKEMNDLSEASKLLKEDAEEDYYRR